MQPESIATPVGAVVDPPPRCVPPRPSVFEGERVRLEPVDPARHAAALFAGSHGNAAAPELWAYMGYGPFADEAAMRAWLAGCAASQDPLFFTVIARGSGEPVGMASLMRTDAANGVIEVGNIWYAPKVQRTALPTEAMLLLFAHVFEELGYRRLEWKCNALNEPSRRAALRFGFTYEGTFRQHMVVKGRNRDTAWFSMLDSEWPAIGRAMRAWVSMDNFDAAHRQIRSLASLRQR
ncbi:GNAT family protein [Geminicoccaceae bacterium 1502E]|nr:GNAT family protein [Geminicoccaceae bacterium 1502E]